MLNAGSNASLAIGLGGASIIGEWHVEANEVSDTGQTARGNIGADRALGIFGLLVLQARIESNLVTYSDPFRLNVVREDRAMYMLGIAEFVVNLDLNQT